MSLLRTILITVVIVSSFLIQTQGADKYTDGNRPYEFGFNIEGEQHRHEKKDENGLVMGEFGFITADGVYHVTVYATDEQGRFKILSMKNIRVKPYPTYKRPEAESVRQGHSLDLEAPKKSIPKAPVREIETPPKEVSIETPGRSCSSCSLPTTTTQAPAPALVQPTYGGNLASVNQPDAFNGQNVGLSPGFPANPQNSFNNPQTKSQQGPGSQNAPAPGFVSTSQNSPKPSKPGSRSFSNQPNAFNGQNVGSSTSFPANQENNFNNPQTYSQQGPGSQNAPAQGFVSTSQNSPNLPSEPGSSSFSNQPNAFNGQKVGSSPSFPAYQENNFNNPQTYSQQGPGSQNAPAQGIVSTSQNSPSFPSGPGSRQPQGLGQDSIGRTAKKYDGQTQNSFRAAGPQPKVISKGAAVFNQGQALPTKPTLISAQMQIVDKNTDIYRRGPGEKEGLPNGLTEGDMTQLLYTFNYTVGFHGHFEEGFRNGAKQGYYYVTGRNGVRTRVDYVADEKGFRPKITQEVLDLLSDEVPKPETEQDEKYGLKGYEFKWLYFPIESKGH